MSHVVERGGGLQPAFSSSGLDSLQRGWVQVSEAQAATKAFKVWQKRGTTATCTVPKGSWCTGNGSGWVRNWDMFPAEGICRENREL